MSSSISLGWAQKNALDSSTQGTIEIDHHGIETILRNTTYSSKCWSSLARGKPPLFARIDPAYSYEKKFEQRDEMQVSGMQLLLQRQEPDPAIDEYDFSCIPELVIFKGSRVDFDEMSDLRDEPDQDAAPTHRQLITVDPDDWEWPDHISSIKMEDLAVFDEWIKIDDIPMMGERSLEGIQYVSSDTDNDMQEL